MKYNSLSILTLIRIGIILIVYALLININSNTRKNTVYLNSIDQSLIEIKDILEQQTQQTNYKY